MSFIDEQDQRLAPLWERVRGHRFLLDTRDGTIPDEAFAVWLRQDYLFVEAAIPFIAALIPRAPSSHWGPLGGVIQALEKELKLFEERAAHAGVELRGAPPSFTCHAYIQFLLATAHTCSFAEGYTVLYAAERAYHESWGFVREGIDPGSPWAPFVENWGGEDFGAYVAYLADELEALAEAAGPAERARMAELYRLTLLYEVAFWEMAASSEGWPGVDDPLAEEAAGPVWNPEGAPGEAHAWAHMREHREAASGSSGPAGRESSREGARPEVDAAASEVDDD